MKEERDIIMQYAIPELEASLKRKGISLDVVDICLDTESLDADLCSHNNMTTILKEQILHCQTHSAGTSMVVCVPSHT